MVYRYISLDLPAARPSKRANEPDTSSRWLYRLPLLLLLIVAGIAVTHGARPPSSFTLYVRAPTWHTHRIVTARSDSRKPPQLPRVYNDTKDSLEKLVKEVVEREKSIVEDSVKKIKPENATFENFLLPFIQNENKRETQLGSIYVLPYVGADEKVDKAITEVSGNLSEVYSVSNTQEFYALVDAVYKKQKDDKKLDEEDRAVIKNIWDEYQSEGFGLPDGPNRKRLKTIDERLGKLGSEFGEVVATDNTTLYYTAEQLDGVPNDFIDTLEKGKGEHEGKLVIPIAIYSNVESLAKHVKNVTIRQEVDHAYNNIAPSNIARLKEAIAIRDEKARIFGYPDFATMHIEGTMAETPKAVDDLLANVRKRLTKAGDAEIEEMKKLKLKQEGNADHFFLWDDQYYTNELNEEVYKVDNEFIKQYFESTTIIQNILNMYAEIYSLRYVKVEGKYADELSPSGKGSDLVWNPDVELFEVWNNETGKGNEGTAFIGYLYVDLFNRKRKDSGSFETSVEPGFDNPDGSRHYPSTAAVLNLVKSESPKPTLVIQDDVRTILHELGHATHHLVSHVKYARFHGPGACPRDFVELPSQLMENWAYDRTVLKRLSKHYSYISSAYKDLWTKDYAKDTKATQPPENLSDEQIDHILKNKNAVRALFELKQAMFSIYDMTIHEQPSQKAAKTIDTTLTWNQMRYNITHIEGPQVLGKGWRTSHHQSAFTHYMQGYQAGYYGYTWSRVIAKDVFYTKFKADPFSSETGSRWRHIVLEPGSSKNLTAILIEFLGRQYNDESFYKDAGIDTQADGGGKLEGQRWWNI